MKSQKKLRRRNCKCWPQIKHHWKRISSHIKLVSVKTSTKCGILMMLTRMGISTEKRQEHSSSKFQRLLIKTELVATIQPFSILFSIDSTKTMINTCPKVRWPSSSRKYSIRDNKRLNSRNSRWDRWKSWSKLPQPSLTIKKQILKDKESLWLQISHMRHWL